MLIAYSVSPIITCGCVNIRIILCGFVGFTSPYWFIPFFMLICPIAASITLVSIVVSIIVLLISFFG